jgi:hypothetical protein
VPLHGAISVVLDSQFCAAEKDFCFLSVRVAYEGLDVSGLCRAWSILIIVCLCGFCSCVALAAAAVFCDGQCCGVGSVPCVWLSVSIFFSFTCLRFFLYDDGNDTFFNKPQLYQSRLKS